MSKTYLHGLPGYVHTVNMSYNYNFSTPSLSLLFYSNALDRRADRSKLSTKAEISIFISRKAFKSSVPTQADFLNKSNISHKTNIPTYFSGKKLKVGSQSFFFIISCWKFDFFINTYLQKSMNLILNVNCIFLISFSIDWVIE